MVEVFSYVFDVIHYSTENNIFYDSFYIDLNMILEESLKAKFENWINDNFPYL